MASSKACSGWFQNFFNTLFIILLALTVANCSRGGGDNSGGDNDKDTGVSFRVEAPAEFDEPFCVRVDVSGPDFATLTTESIQPAGTRFIDTVIPNIPEGTDRVVEMGIFASGDCDVPAAGDWYGIARDVVVVAGEVTIVHMKLIQQSPAPGTGTIIIRDDGTFYRTLLHGEVVNTDNDPITGASCDISENGNVIGNVVSSADASNLGVLNTPVEVQLGTTELTLNCTHPGYSPAMETARLVLDPADPRNGTFIATVEMKRGVSIELLRSDETGLAARVHVPAIRLLKVDSSFGEFDKVDNTDNAYSMKGGGIDNLSLPEIPVLTLFYAVPVGEEPAEVVVTPDSDGVVMSARLFPVQPPHRDAAGPEKGDPNVVDDEPFVFNEDMYLRGVSSVRDFSSSADADSDSDVNIYELRINLVDYDPAKLVMTHYQSLMVDIKFGGASSCFKYNRTADGFDMDGIDRRIEAQRSIITSNIINSNVLQNVCNLGIKPIFFGARLIIIAPPDLIPAANDLRAHKISRGISTVVVSTATISAGTITAPAIKNYLTDAYNNWWIRPKWLLLMGDAEHIPTHYGNQNSWDSALNAGDIYYGQIGSDTLSLPVFGIGRLPVDTNTQAQTIVDKIKAFENNPPASIIFDNPYYSDATFAAEFQDDGAGDGNFPLDGIAERWFAETSERIRNHLITQDIGVERIYEVEPSASNPTTYRDGNPVPLYLRKPTFAWDGDTADIINATNDGTSILYHRDHGWWSGWGTPDFRTSDLASISVSNNEFPVVYSINCASGIFDNETVDDPANKVGFGYGPNPGSVYWGETFIRKSDGAIAVIGDTRSSSTTLNNDLAEGLFDATWPGHLAYGPNTVVRRVGDILNHAKGYVKSRGYGNSSTQQELKIYNLFGDPTVEVRTRPPQNIGFTTIFREINKIILDIQCLTCPPTVEPINVVIQDLKGNFIGRGTASIVGPMFRVEVDVGDFSDAMKVTASGADVLPEETIFDDGGSLP